MEITNIKETMISAPPQGTTPGRVKKSGQPDEQAGRSDGAVELLENASKGAPEDVKGLLVKDTKGLKDKTPKDLTEETIKRLTERINDVIDAMHYSIQFVVDREAGGVVIKVVDSDGKLIRRIPPEIMESFSNKGVDLGLLLNAEL